VTEQGLPGVVVRAYGKYFDVLLDDEPRILLSTLKGTLKRERRRTDLVAVGDHVSVIDVGEGEGQIEAVMARERVLARLARHSRDVEQVILANPDQVLFLFAIKNPKPHRRMLDRFLVLAESQGLPALIGLNKIDLIEGGEDREKEEAIRFLDDYRGTYPVFTFSVATGAGVEQFRDQLSGKVTAVAGPSGVGKSSLLNMLDPIGDRGVATISDATGKGRHTTTATQLYRIGDETWVADTPGIRALAMHAVEPGMLDRYFPEFQPFLGECFYPDCTHVHEPACAIRAAADRDAIPLARYESYVSLRTGESDD
jgi:ribosome biogenesis GTPase